MLIPAMKRVIDASSAFGVDSFVIGMPHRFVCASCNIVELDVQVIALLPSGLKFTYC